MKAARVVRGQRLVRKNGVVNVDIVFRAVNDVEGRIIDQMLNAPCPAKCDFIRRHKEMVEGDLVLL